MARHGDTRSPSPVGSTYSSSRRSRRDDSRPERRRDEGRGHRRSRSPEILTNLLLSSADTAIAMLVAIETATADAIVPADRRDDNTYRPGRRDRSRDRRRDDDRDYRRRSRDRDYRARRDDSRDRDRRRTDDSADLKPKSRREDSRDRGVSRRSGSRALETSKPTTPTPATQTEEDKKAERRAKLEAWKQKQAAERERKQREEGESVTPAESAPPAPYAGKFDPKAIAKNATNNTAPAPAVLGTDVAVPQSIKATVQPPASPSVPSAHTSAPLKAKGNVSGFGLGAKTAIDAEKPSASRTLGFGEEESTRKKLERLPTPPLDDSKDTGVNDEAAEDDDVDMQDGDNEEEAAAAARLAAERREERLQTQSRAYQTQGDVPEGKLRLNETNGANGDVDMADSNQEPEPSKMEVDEEEIDPLDAFMSDLADKAPPKKTFGAKLGKKKDSKPPQAIFGDEDDVDITAVGEEDADDVLAMANKKKKKEIPTIDHKKIEYEPFRRKFYNEPSHLAEMTEEETANLRLELDGIKVRGLDIPKPVQKWSQCGLGMQTLEVVDKLGYEGLTSIQAQAIPAIMSGRDVIGVAKTGSGKTIAFLIPMFRHIKDQRPLENMEGPIALIMTPTRELATQIHKDCKPFLKALGLRAVCAYGGAPIKDQIAELKRGAEIVVCTPGRMIDLLAANGGRVTNLRRVTYVVLDEADRMFDMGFEPQVMKIMANIRPDKQTVLFSATFPRNMEALARKTLKKPVEIVVGGKSVVAPEITQIVEVRNEDEKFFRLLELLGNLYADDANEDCRTLIFVEKQESADNLLRELMRKGYPCMSIHGGKDQVDRDSTIEDFKAGIFPILTATSVAARGLDVKQLKLVVNYDAPNHLEDYVHRAGRTGRAGNTGTAVTFLTEDQERYSVDIAKALKQSGQEIPEPVQKLVDSFLEKVRAGKEKASTSGFGGKGLERLDQERETARNRERRTYKTGDGDDEEEEKDEKTKQADEDRFNKALSQVQSAAAPSAPSGPLPGVPKGIDLDGKITVHKTEKDPNAPSKNALDKVGSAVADIHARLSKAGVMRSGVPIDNRGPDAGAFHATLEINDFPQKARWAVTNRTNVAKILEATGTSITTKGNFYAAGKEPGPNDLPKLYILVEGETEISVTTAMRELMRLLKEGTIAAADSDARAPASGRYNVV
ncbi:Pre-mRNA-processing ATP-dependent RNA helicase prp5 [Penicillium maclennaniae]|uniref:Pre-mRNA-processing ATP-dependent RNA helicase prp5 n=1 Tax=Penicillium maclennaniae TaxID=1343394 RepID=UPI0025413F8A|nr:Pre-mRNA-processing ATP-dependent RNA helicase prp5 [Penicillium maclennaniae]KAJ5684656.1 Pre-mRNA-processing ATP-dependent RNA helicase prp5 [Penicillium maclennaniae]